MLTCIAAVLVAAAPAPAVSLSGEVEAEARALAGVTAPDEAFVARLDAFASRAMALSDALRAADAPDDLPCIFRGISEDARARAAEFASAADAASRERALVGLRVLLNDAALLAPMAGRELADR